MAYAIGIDPDVKTPAFAAYNMKIRKVEAVGCIKVKFPPGAKGQERLPFLGEQIGLHINEVLTLNGFPSVEVLCVEGQTIRKNSAATPQSLLMLAAAAGMVAQAAYAAWAPSRVVWAGAHQWKGDVPKRIHQARVCRRLGWEYTSMGGPLDGYVAPSNHGCEISGKVNPSDWKHIMDAVGLAVYAGNGCKR